MTPVEIIRLRLRGLSIALGVVILFWLPIEDTHLTFATILAYAICFLGTTLVGNKWQLTSHLYPGLGFLGGLCVGPVGFMLMVLKIGLHNHGTPDFTLAQLIRLLFLAPTGAISGFLFGLGLHLYHISRRR
jgi:hypothetical protein